MSISFTRSLPHIAHFLLHFSPLITRLSHIDLGLSSLTTSLSSLTVFLLRYCRVPSIILSNASGSTLRNHGRVRNRKYYTIALDCNFGQEGKLGFDMTTFHSRHNYNFLAPICMFICLIIQLLRLLDNLDRHYWVAGWIQACQVKIQNSNGDYCPNSHLTGQCPFEFITLTGFPNLTIEILI